MSNTKHKQKEVSARSVTGCEEKKPAKAVLNTVKYEEQLKEVTKFIDEKEVQSSHVWLIS